MIMKNKLKIFEKLTNETLELTITEQPLRKVVELMRERFLVLVPNAPKVLVGAFENYVINLVNFYHHKKDFIFEIVDYKF